MRLRRANVMIVTKKRRRRSDHDIPPAPGDALLIAEIDWRVLKFG